MKNIYIEPDEEIISVVDRLMQTKSSQINIVIPAGAQLWQSSINLRLLKREADALGNEVVLVVPDDFCAEMSEKAGFPFKKEKDFSIELSEQKEAQETLEADFASAEKFLPKKEEEKKKASEKDMIKILIDDLETNRKMRSGGLEDNFFQKKQEKPQGTLAKHKDSEKRVADIVNPDFSKKEGFFKDGFFKKKKKDSPTSKNPPEIVRLGENRSAFSGRSEKSKWPKAVIGLAVVSFVFAGVLAYLTLPKAEITLFPYSEEIEFSLLGSGAKDVSSVDSSLNEIPLQEISIKETGQKEFPATGEEQLERKARGTITIYNEYSSSPQTLVATTRFASPEGKIFRIFEKVIVPGASINEGKIVASSIEVEVVADQPGEEYNIEPSNFTIPGFKGTAKYSGFYGKSEASMSGGSTKKVKIILEKDIEEAKKSLSEDLVEAAKGTFQEQIPDHLQIIDQAVKEETEIVSLSAEAGDQAEKAILELEATAQALLYNPSDISQLIEAELAEQISEERMSLSETRKVDWQEIEIDWEKKEANFTLEVRQRIASEIDIAQLKSDLAGKNETEVRRYLVSRPEIESAQIMFWPFWVKRIPLQQDRIEIKIKEN